MSGAQGPWRAPRLSNTERYSQNPVFLVQGLGPGEGSEPLQGANSDPPCDT